MTGANRLAGDYRPKAICFTIRRGDVENRTGLVLHKVPAVRFPV